MTTANTPDPSTDRPDYQPQATPPGQPPTGAKPADPQPKRRRLWPKVLLAVVAVVVLLVLLLPTLLSTAPARSFVVGKINQNLNGRVEIGDWKISWTGGITINGLRIFDDRDSQIAQVEWVSTELSLLQAARGNLALGQTVVRGADFTLIQNPDGTFNFSNLAKPSNKPDEPASDLPNVSGNLRVENSRGTFVRNTGDPATSSRVKLSDITAAAVITDINQPIDHNLSLKASVNDGPAGTLAIKGKAAVVANRRVNLESGNLDETIELGQLDAGALAAFVPPTVLRQLGGQLSGSVVATLTGGKVFDLRGKLAGQQIVVATPRFAPGETYRSDTMSIVLPLKVELPKGLSNTDAAIVRTDGTIALHTAQVQLDITIDAPLASLTAAASNQAVASPGKLKQTLVVDLPAVAAMLPQTLGLKPGTTLEGGKLSQSVTVDLSPGQSALAVGVDLGALTGSAPIADAQGVETERPFKVEPVSLKLGTVTRGGGWAAPDLRDLSLQLTSGFASGNIAAPTLATLKGTLDADLARLQQQLGQFMTLDGMTLAGQLKVVADSTGDPTKPADPASFSVVVTGNDLQTVIAGKPIRQQLVRATVGGTVLRTEAGDIKEVRDVRVSSLVGTEASPTVDLQVVVPQVNYVPAVATTPARYDIPQYTIAKAVVALRQAQADFGGFIPALNDYNISDGTASVAGTGSLMNGTIRFDGNVATDNVDLSRYFPLSSSGPGARLRHSTAVVTDYTMTTQVGLSYEPQPQGGARVNVAKLQIGDNRRLVSVRTVEELVLILPPPPASGATPAAGIQASGRLAMDIDLAQTHDLSRRALATTQQVIAEATATDKPVLVRKGILSATLDLKQQADGAIALSLDGGVDALTVAGNKPILTDEKVTLALKASTAPGLVSAVLDQLQVRSGIANVDASGQFVLSRGTGPTAERVPPLEMVRKLNAKVTAPNLGKLQELVAAMTTPSQVAVSDEFDYRAGPFAVALVQADGGLPAGTPLPASQPAEAPSVMDQIAELRISELSANGVGASVGLKEPIVVRNLTELKDLFTAKPTAPQATPATAAVAPPATQPAAPARVAGGALNLGIDVIGDGKTLSVTPTVQATGLSMTVGTATRELGDINLKSTVAIVSRPTGAPAAAPALSGAVTLAGTIEPLMELSAFMKGEPPRSPYAGTLDLTQAFSTEGAVIRLKGSGTVTDFAARDAAGKPTFTEKAIRLEDDLAFDTTGVGTLSLTKLGVIFESSGALSAAVTGRLIDLSQSRKFENVVADLTYDAEKLWPILRAMMADPAVPPEQDSMKDYVVRGKSSRRFTVAGSLPAVDERGAPLATTVALRNLDLRGSLGLDLVQAEGLTLEKIELPVTLADGTLRLADDTKPANEQLPPPIACNGGTINIGGLLIDLNGALPVLSTPENLPLLSKVQLNPTLSNFLGGLVNNPLFVPSADTKGIVDLTIIRCQNVPLGKMFKQHGRENKGFAEATFDFSGAQFKNDLIVGITTGLAQLTQVTVDADSWQGSIRNGKVTYTNGYVGHDMTFVLGEQQAKSVRLYGNSRLSDKNLLPLTMLFSSAWFGGDFARYVPAGLPLPLTGPFNAPQYNLGVAVQETIKQNYFSGKPEDVANLLELFGGKKKTPTRDDGGGAATMPSANASAGNPQTQPAPKQPDTPLGILGDLLGQAARDREKKEQEKKEKERRERERREQRKRQNEGN